MLDSEGLDQNDGERMQAYFNKSGAEDFVPTESNRRTILPEIELTEAAYKSKKVHRKDLEQKVSSSEEDEEDEEGNSEEGEAEIITMASKVEKGEIEQSEMDKSLHPEDPRMSDQGRKKELASQNYDESVTPRSTRIQEAKIYRTIQELKALERK